MVHKLAMETAIFRGIAAFSTALLRGVAPRADGPKVSVLQVHGTADNTCPYNGGQGVLGYNFRPAEESSDVWANHNQCDAGRSSNTADGNIRIEYLNCAQGTSVLHYGLRGQGHGLNLNVEGGFDRLMLDFFRIP